MGCFWSSRSFGSSPGSQEEEIKSAKEMSLHVKSFHFQDLIPGSTCEQGRNLFVSLNCLWATPISWLPGTSGVCQVASKYGETASDNTITRANYIGGWRVRPGPKPRTRFRGAVVTRYEGYPTGTAGRETKVMTTPVCPPDSAFWPNPAVGERKKLQVTSTHLFTSQTV